MKLPNGTGTVTKLPGTRRRPYMARITTGWTDEGKQLRKILGYYPTKKEALEALMAYNADPYDLSARSLTFSEVYELWSAEYFPTLANKSSARTYTAAYNHSKTLWDMTFSSIKTSHLENTIEKADTGTATKSRMKSMYNMLFRYAIKHEITDKDYAQLCKAVKNSAEKHHEPFTDEEIKRIEALQAPFVDLVIICIYTGLRPQEMAILKRSDIDFDKLTITGGIKTEAGKNRVIPIHPHIKPLIQARYQMSEGHEALILDRDGAPMTYDRYRHRFEAVMECAGITDHSPHDTRSTFITRAKAVQMDEYILKRIVGHTITDLTERVYTKRDIDQLHREIQKIKA